MNAMNTTPPSTSRPTLSQIERQFAVDLESHRGWLRGLASRRVRGRADIEDLVQDAMMRAWQSRRSFEAGSNLKSWLATILLNKARSDGRSRTRFNNGMDRFAAERACEPGAPQPPATFERLAVMRAVDDLPACFRATVELVDLGGASYAEAADVLQVPCGTIMSRLHRARMLLAERLSPFLQKAPERRAA